MKDKLTEALKKSTADYAEIRIFADEALQFAYRGKEAERASAWSGCGGIARACTKGGWGVVSFDSMDDLAVRVREACECAALVGKEKTELAPAAPVEAEKRVQMKKDFRGVALDDKIKLIEAYNNIILGAGPSIQSSYVAYDEMFRTVHFASTNGSYYMEERPKVTMMYNATARDGNLLQHAHDSIASSDDYSVVLGNDETVREIADRAVALLKAPKCDAGTFTVVLDPRLAGVFAHEAFGHLSEADFLHENPRMRELMHLGRALGVKDLNITDDGTYPCAIGTAHYDDEGVPTSRVPLITNGILTAHLHSRETAAKMGEKPTGNARACWKEQSPIVRMRNTFIENGRTPVDELFANIEKGIYACDAFGGQTEFEMFTFSAAYGYRIEKGEAVGLLRDVVLTGNVFETLKRIDGFGNDFRVCQSGGGCGKGGQGPLPVTFGSPHIRIRDVVIGGN